MKKKFFIATKTSSQINLIKSLVKDVDAFDDVVFLGDDDTSSILEIRYIEDISLASSSYEKEVFIHNTLPIWNSSSVAALKVFGISKAYYLASYELTMHELRELEASTKDSGYEIVLPIYGYIPVMRTKNCIKKTNGACNKKSEFLSIKDKKGAKFPVESDCDKCENIIYNSVPLSIHKYIEKENYDNYYLSFTIESDEQISKIITFYNDFFLRVSTMEFPVKYTTGHFVKGVL